MRLATAALVMAIAATLGCEGLPLTPGTNPTGSDAAMLSAPQLADGVRATLKLATERASDNLGRAGGYADNPLYRITLPDELQSLRSTLQRVGMGGQLQAVEDLMNRGAELAAAGEERYGFTFDAERQATRPIDPLAEEVRLLVTHLDGHGHLGVDQAYAGGFRAECSTEFYLDVMRGELVAARAIRAHGVVTAGDAIRIQLRTRGDDLVDICRDDAVDDREGADAEHATERHHGSGRIGADIDTAPRGLHGRLDVRAAQSVAHIADEAADERTACAPRLDRDFGGEPDEDQR